MDAVCGDELCVFEVVFVQYVLCMYAVYVCTLIKQQHAKAHDDVLNTILFYTLNTGLLV